VQTVKLFLLTNQALNPPKQIFSLRVHPSFLLLEVKDLEWTTFNMFLRELGKEELSFTMELIGEQFVMMQIST